MDVVNGYTTVVNYARCRGRCVHRQLLKTTAILKSFLSIVRVISQQHLHGYSNAKSDCLSC